MLDEGSLLTLHLLMHQYRDDPKILPGLVVRVALPTFQAKISRVINDNQDFLVADGLPDHCKMLTQNLRKPTENTQWVLEDPAGRGISWLICSDNYIGEARHFVEPGRGDRVCTVTMFGRHHNMRGRRRK
jgi:hypothetical protein